MSVCLSVCRSVSWFVGRSVCQFVCEHKYSKNCECILHGTISREGIRFVVVILTWLMLVVLFQFLDVPAARLIFEVTIEGSARKVITVRSALMLRNQLEDEVEVRLINQIRGSAGQICNMRCSVIVIGLKVLNVNEFQLFHLNSLIHNIQ